ncbi:uncharacterized protein LOC129588381 [Paramacrobiotus metropolitanus]|uniref:uncharacterized protein LOC129588381 n=1 Tax=Paramacrobiotus metropolitanus TaxID=2943436 RepID=UPI0024461AB3|nr:uncharacterized protein LOC129588381 [Paramacrobiotus metropolitanus]
MEPIFGGQLHNRCAVITFGAFQVTVGLLLILLDGGDFIFEQTNSYINYGMCSALYYTILGSGFWTGGFFVITGAFGIAAGQRIPDHKEPRSRRCHLITSLVLSILGLLLAAIMAPAAYFYASQPVLLLCLEKYPSSQIVPMAHVVLFGIMVVLNFGQLVSSSVNISKLPPRIAAFTYTMTTTAVPAQQQMIATAVHTHPAGITPPQGTFVIPPYYAGQQQSYIQQAVETHPK